MTVPRFDLEEINSGLYSLGETQLINQIAITYVMGGGGNGLCPSEFLPAMR